MTTPKLKPCPFCGAKAKVSKWCPPGPFYIAKCKEGHTIGFLHLSKQAAANEWNERASK